MHRDWLAKMATWEAGWGPFDQWEVFELLYDFPSTFYWRCKCFTQNHEWSQVQIESLRGLAWLADRISRDEELSHKTNLHLGTFLPSLLQALSTHLPASWILHCDFVRSFVLFFFVLRFKAKFYHLQLIEQLVPVQSLPFQLNWIAIRSFFLTASICQSFKVLDS